MAAPEPLADLVIRRRFGKCTDIGGLWLAHGAAANLAIGERFSWIRRFCLCPGFGEGISFLPFKDCINDREHATQDIGSFNLLAYSLY